MNTHSLRSIGIFAMAAMMAGPMFSEMSPLALPDDGPVLPNTRKHAPKNGSKVYHCPGGGAREVARRRNRMSNAA